MQSVASPIFILERIHSAHWENNEIQDLYSVSDEAKVQQKRFFLIIGGKKHFGALFRLTLLNNIFNFFHWRRSFAENIILLLLTSYPLFVDNSKAYKSGRQSVKQNSPKMRREMNLLFIDEDPIAFFSSKYPIFPATALADGQKQLTKEHLASWLLFCSPCEKT